MIKLEVNTEERDSIVKLARGWLGTPYHHQAKLRGVGCDCLGLVRGVWEEFYGVTEPEKPEAYTKDWAEATGEELMLGAARRHFLELPLAGGPKAGDVLIYRHNGLLVAKHAGIYTGGDRMVHAIEGRAVSEVYLGTWWRNQLAGRFAFASRATEGMNAFSVGG